MNKTIPVLVGDVITDMAAVDIAVSVASVI